MLFKNKHLIVAMLVAPILAIIAWFGVDLIVADKAESPQSGKDYKLAERANCRWQSGECDLKNGNFEINLKPVFLENNAMEIRLHSNFPLEGAKLAVASGPTDESAIPASMKNEDFSHTRWNLRLAEPLEETSRLQLAVKQNGVFYYADASTTFIVTE